MKYSHLITFSLLIILATPSVYGQANTSFQIANRLMQQQRYQDALPILQELSNQQPETFLFLDRLVESFIQLKQYNAGLEIVKQRIQSGYNVELTNVLLGELYHFTGDTTRAYQIWDDNLAANERQLQLYVNTANKLTNRREFSRAIAVYRKAQQVFNTRQIFAIDIPNVYMQAGQYQKAIAEWLAIIEGNPEQSTSFRRLLIRYNDPLLFDDSIAEVEFMLQDMAINNPAYTTFYELQIWLLFENKLYRRAYAAAREYEISTSNFNYALYNVARTLAENNEYELALQAYAYYTNSQNAEVRWRAAEQQADVYMRWAKYLDKYSLDLENNRTAYFSSASNILDSIINESSNYSRIRNVFLLKAEIALDYIFDLEAAKKVTTQLKSFGNSGDTPEANYLDGRIYLADRAFTQARISFTRANKLAEVGELAEKTRYFLALTDFYAGDFEYSQIQLKTLGRQNTSYYANDALELRLWVQEGLAADSTGAQLTEFAGAHFKLFIGEDLQAKEQFRTIVNAESTTPFKDDVFILMAKTLTEDATEYISLISQYLNESPYTSVKEQLLWLKAFAIEQIISTDTNRQAPETNIFFSKNMENLTQTYEDLIFEFPRGFYAPHARKRLAELPKVNS